MLTNDIINFKQQGPGCYFALNFFSLALFCDSALTGEEAHFPEFLFIRGSKEEITKLVFPLQQTV